MSQFEIISTIAIVLGPVIAVLLSIAIQNRIERSRRRHIIFSELMRTRGSPLEPAHYSAINLIVLEFHKNKEIVRVHAEYMNLLNSFPSSDPDVTNHIGRVTSKSAELLQKIGEHLGYKYDKDDLNRLAYRPTAAARFQDNQFENSTLLRDLLRGNISLPVEVHMPASRAENKES